MTTTTELLSERQAHVPRGIATTHPIVVAKAKGALVVDVEGVEYIDFAGGIGVNNLGHCNEDVLQAVRDQIEKYVHPCFHVALYEPYVQLAKKLNAVAPGDFPKKTMLVNSGAEAVENAIKIARHATGRPAILAFEGAFHGRTLLAMSLTSKVTPFKRGFGPYAPEVYRLPYAYCYRCSFGLTHPSCQVYCARFLKDFFAKYVPAEQVAGLIVEPVLGEGGFVVPPREYLAALKSACEEAGIVFIADEIQTGFGRTARIFAVEHFGVAPDIILTAKSLAGGFPLAAVTGRSELMDHPPVGGLGGTFGGNPVACRAALAVLDQLAGKELLKRAAVLGETVLTRFREFQEWCLFIGDVRGIGAMVGMELVVDRQTKEPATELTRRLIDRCREKGLLMVSAGVHSNVIRSLMPLVITDAQLERGLAIIEESLRELHGAEKRGD
jgi:4-aminobutyrate aminotransferase / (S)-3-amino-2-methylpropionate transaminase / 5-aminovalerate transaminase